jgi:hypothetical protein
MRESPAKVGPDQMNERKPADQDDREETESERRTMNIVLVVAAVVLVGGGIWLVNALVDANKAQLCMESGRRNCNPIRVEPKRD